MPILFHPETSQRRALILALGTYGTEGLSPGEREPMIGKLLDLYRNDPDSGIHGAAEWTLRQWGQQEKLKELDAQLMKLKDRGDRRWYVNSQGQTFAVIEGPVEFRMGSPPTEQVVSLDDETLHRQTIPRRLAIAAKEVTVEQFQQFVKHPKHEQYDSPKTLDSTAPIPRQGPMIAFDWYHCRRLLQLAEPQGEPAEVLTMPPPNGQSYAEGMKIRADALQRTGYRLPTEAEWEYACRAGAMTSRYYGLSEELLGQYAWYLANTQGSRLAVRHLFPNDLGLFDMLGNVYEWCHDQYACPPDRQRWESMMI